MFRENAKLPAISGTGINRSENVVQKKKQKIILGRGPWVKSVFLGITLSLVCLLGIVALSIAALIVICLAPIIGIAGFLKTIGERSA